LGSGLWPGGMTQCGCTCPHGRTSHVGKGAKEIPGQIMHQDGFPADRYSWVTLISAAFFCPPEPAGRATMGALAGRGTSCGMRDGLVGRRTMGALAGRGTSCGMRDGLVGRRTMGALAGHGTSCGMRDGLVGHEMSRGLVGRYTGCGLVGRYTGCGLVGHRILHRQDFLHLASSALS
jgi:hypothetical protein